MTTNPYKSTLEDLEWLWTEWWVDRPDELSPGHLRRGSASLHLLLAQGLLGKAWRAYGFPKQPKVTAPDVQSLLIQEGLKPERAMNCIAGGGHQRGVSYAFVGMFRVDNPTTGVPADEEEGFAVQTTAILTKSDGTDLSTLPTVDGLRRREWYLTEYLKSISAIRDGTVFSRLDILEYFRNYSGGAHHDLVDQSTARKTSNATYALLTDLDSHVVTDIRTGVHFELLSIGQAIATSPDVHRLMSAMRSKPFPIATTEQSISSTAEGDSSETSVERL